MTEQSDNPFRLVLFWISIVAIVGGLLLLGVGSALSTLPWIVWGACVAAAGVSALLLWLAVSAITWRPAEH